MKRPLEAEDVGPRTSLKKAAEAPTAGGDGGDGRGNGHVGLNGSAANHQTVYDAALDPTGNGIVTGWRARSLFLSPCSPPPQIAPCC